MKYEAGNRFTPETYLKTEAESGTSVSLKVTGELEGVEVSFDSGDVPELTTLTATENRTYEAPEGTAYNEVTVNVPNSYTAADEGKVVDQGALVSQTSTTKTANGTYNTTTNNEVVIEVPNTYTAADEGKVVDQGALVSQTSTTKTANGTYDTTLNNEVVINVSGGGDTDFIEFIEGVTTDLVIPAGTTAIRARFCDTDSVLETVKIPDSVTSIGETAFRNCNALTSVEIGTGITSIGNYSLWRSTSDPLSITIHATTPPTIQGTSFSTSPKPTFYVPAASVEAYKTATNWTQFASNINAIPTP